MVEAARVINENMPIQHLEALLVIAQHPDCDTREVQKRLGTTPASASRNVNALLSGMTRMGKPGYGLVEQKPNPLDGRSKTNRLSTKGQGFIQKLIDILDD